jgi:hypothetical protein
MCAAVMLPPAGDTRCSEQRGGDCERAHDHPSRQRNRKAYGIDPGKCRRWAGKVIFGGAVMARSCSRLI